MHQAEQEACVETFETNLAVGSQFWNEMRRTNYAARRKDSQLHFPLLTMGKRRFSMERSAAQCRLYLWADC